MIWRVLEYITERGLSREERAMRNIEISVVFCALVFCGYAVGYVLEHAPK